MFKNTPMLTKIKLFCALFTLTLISPSVFAQDVITSFEKQYNATTAGTPERYSIASRYVKVLFAHKQTEKATKILKSNITAAEKEKDGQYASNLYCAQAMNLFLLEEHELSTASINKAIFYSNRTKNEIAKGYLSYTQGWISARNNNTTKAIQFFLNALKHYEKTTTTTTVQNNLSATYNELATIYANLDEFDLHEHYSKLSLDAALKQDDPESIFTSYMNMGYLYQKKFSQNNSQYEYRALTEKYYLQAIDFYQKNPKKMATPSNLSFAAINLSNVYFYFYEDTKLDKAIYYAELARESSLETRTASHIAASYGMLSEIALKQNNIKKAKTYLLGALVETQNTTMKDNNITLSIFESLTSISESEGNYEEALKYQKEFLTVFKTIYDQEKLAISKRLESQFQKERQEQQMLRLQLESEKKEQQIQLMHALGIQQEQELVNTRLTAEFQTKKLKLSDLENEKRIQELKLSRLENKNRINELTNYKTELSFKEKINKYYISLLFVFGLLFCLLLYSMRQRSKSMKQKEKLYHLQIEKERQNSKISTLTALLEGQEKERARLARDLHDGLGGLLSGTKLQLTHLNDKIDEIGKIAMKKSISQIDGAVDELRRVAHNLMPDLLMNYGLEEALKEYANRMSNEHLDIDVQFLSYTKNLDQEKQLLIYRIIQELVNNAVKHAQATQIIIQFVEEENQYMVTIEDDGKGFDVDNTNKKQSAGLYNIKSRVEFLKGDLNIHSDEKLGTSIEFQFPKT